MSALRRMQIIIAITILGIVVIITENYVILKSEDVLI